MVSKKVAIKEAEERFAELISLAASGVEVILTGDDDTPRARLLPPAQNAARREGLHIGAMKMTLDFDEELPLSFWTGEE